MEVTIGSRIKHAWNAFLNRDPTSYYRDIGVGYSYRPDRPRLTRGNERSIVKKSDLEDIGEEAEDQKERIDEKKNTEIERLMAIEIPSGLSKEERAKRVAERNEKIAKLRDDASEDKSKVSEQAKAEKEEVRTSASRKKKRITEDTKEERADNSANAKSEREKVSAELKAAVTAAREAYKAAKENLDATYEDLYQQEFDKIASEYKAVKKRKRRK